ncbi:MAG: hypothetical protein GC180_05055 [Bacteroidetes bacterium]|nr:hypothetical protein [Bacteroidota bacterium]
MFQFKAFRAIDEPEYCREYTEGHVRVLKDYGITNITSNNNEWASLDCVYCVVVYNEAGEMVGGIRMQKADGVHKLPVEKAIGYRDPSIYKIVASYIPEGVGELCALWNAKSVAGKGLSLLLSRAGISICSQVGISTMVGICADYTLKMFRKVGFVVDETLGEGGEFVYPNENYIARVLGILNARNLETAEEEDRLRMLSLRSNPEQKTIEYPGIKDLEIEYNLKLNSK